MVVKFDGHEEEAFDVDNATFTNVIVVYRCRCYLQSWAKEAIVFSSQFLTWNQNSTFVLLMELLPSLIYLKKNQWWFITREEEKYLRISATICNYSSSFRFVFCNFVVVAMNNDTHIPITSTSSALNTLWNVSVLCKKKNHMTIKTFMIEFKITRCLFDFINPILQIWN